MMRRTIRTVTSFLAVLLLSVLFTGAALAQDSDTNYPPATAADSSAEKGEVSDGDLQRISGEGLEPGSEATLRVLGTTFTQTVGSDGTVTFEFRIPEGTEDGTYTYEIEGTDADGNAVVLAGSFEVDGSLPVTGGQFTVGMGLAAVVLILGAALVLVSRKKTREFEIEAQ